jgi:ubiquinone/menaquinone biosynthesis C-methylase UbiE
LNERFDPISYKEELKKLWNEKAEIYHERYVSKKVGPFKSLEELIAVAQLQRGDRVLDVATGTGIVAVEAVKKVGNNGKVVGIDISTGPLAIARRTAGKTSNLQFLEMDAEDLKFPDRSFDVVLSEFALMFFPDSQKALREMKRVLVNDGRIAVSVHGSADNVPYLSIIMSALTKFVPDIIPTGRPGPHRFGEPSLLRAEFEKSGFSDINVAVYTYTYSAGTFEEYWSEYMESAAASIKAKVESLDGELYNKIKDVTKTKTQRFVRDGKIELPWQVLVASARS